MGYPKFNFNIKPGQAGKRDRKQTIPRALYRARKERKP